MTRLEDALVRFWDQKRLIFHPCASTDFEQVKIEQVNDKVLRIKDYSVGS